MPSLESLDIDAVIACVDIVGRSGGRQFEIGWLRDADDPEYDERGPGWYASALYKGARLIADEKETPDEAADALARKLLGGGQCTHCGRRVALSDTPGTCRWRRAGQTWERGCADNRAPGPNRAERRRRARRR